MIEADSKTPFFEAKAILDQYVGQGFPGAALGIYSKKHGDFITTAGFTAYPNHGVPVAPVTEGTIFDLASLTKPLATGAITLNLLKNKLLNLDDTLGILWPRFKSSPWAEVTVAHLLAHSSGMKDHYEFAHMLPKVFTPSDAGSLKTQESVAEIIATSPPLAAPGSLEVYSDLGFIILGMLIQRLTGKSLAELFDELVAGPLGLASTLFTPNALKPHAIFAATELCPLRKTVLSGEVHDSNCYLLGGIAGHAGLFSTITETLAMAKAVTFGTGPFKDIQTFMTKQAGPPNASRVLAFDTASLAGSSAGDLVPPQTIGHLGYTGTSMWVNQQHQTAIVLLTNRVHPTRDNILIRKIRPLIHDAIWRELAL